MDIYIYSYNPKYSILKSYTNYIYKTNMYKK